MTAVNFCPLVAGLVHSDSPDVGMALHFLIAVIIGASFGLLFQPDVRSLGSSMGWGLGYGIFWWFLGPLTLLPVLQGQPIDWSYEHGDRKSTRLNSSHQIISYAVFCLKKKKLSADTSSPCA